MYEEITAVAKRVLASDFLASDANITWTMPRESGRGDLSTTVALELGMRLQKKPLDIACALAQALGKSALVEKAEAVAPGYVNITLTPDTLLKELNRTRSAQTAKVASKKAPPVIVEYSQPNIAKPLGVHHIIGTVMGQATVNLYRHAGHSVISWNYIGDWGTQFGKLAVAYEKWGKGKPVSGYSIDDLLKLYVRFHDEVGQDPSLEEKGREAFRMLEHGDAHLRTFWEDVVAVTKASLEGVYRRLHVSFDLDLGESFYEDKVAGVLEEGKKKGVFTEGEGGALIVKFPEAKNMPPYLVLKGDGATLYSTRDLAQMRYRMDTYHPEKILIFTDIAQKLHFEQLVETTRMLGWETPAFENVLFGRMRFVDSSMSTRTGNILNLEQVLDEAVKRAEAIIRERGESVQTSDPVELAEMMGIGALVYGILSQNRKMDIVFDWDKCLSFEGNSAPYLQYTHARAKSVLRKSDSTEYAFPQHIDALTAHERRLISMLLQFPRVLEETLQSHMPHKLANYLYELCQTFNAFYNAEPILKAAEPEKKLRLALTSFTAAVLGTGANILTLRVPERM